MLIIKYYFMTWNNSFYPNILCYTDYCKKRKTHVAKSGTTLGYPVDDGFIGNEGYAVSALE